MPTHSFIQPRGWGTLSTLIAGTDKTHRQVECGVDAERRLLGGESFAGAQDVILVAGTGFLVTDVAEGLMAAQRRVIGLADCQEVGSQVPRHHLARVDENVHCEEPEGVNA